MCPHSLSGSRRCGKLYWWKSWFTQFSLDQKFDKQNHFRIFRICPLTMPGANRQFSWPYFYQGSKIKYLRTKLHEKQHCGATKRSAFNRKDWQLLSLFFMTPWRQRGTAIEAKFIDLLDMLCYSGCDAKCFSCYWPGIHLEMCVYHASCDLSRKEQHCENEVGMQP